MTDDERAALAAVQRRVEVATDQTGTARAERDEMICLLRRRHETVSEIARVVGLTRKTVHTILRENGVTA